MCSCHNTEIRTRILWGMDDWKAKRGKETDKNIEKGHGVVDKYTGQKKLVA